MPLLLGLLVLLPGLFWLRAQPRQEQLTAVQHAPAPTAERERLLAAGRGKPGAVSPSPRRHGAWPEQICRCWECCRTASGYPIRYPAATPGAGCRIAARRGDHPDQCRYQQRRYDDVRLYAPARLVVRPGEQ